MATTDIIVDDNANKPSLMDKNQGTPTESLAAWISEKVDLWERHRDQNYLDLWKEYYRLWRGQWSAEDKSRRSERSRIISPALQQAIESSVSELEEATFGRVRWIDLEDDRQDQDPSDVAELNNQLLEDFEMDGIPAAISETYLNGALYGTGIAKIIIEETREMILDPNSVDGFAPEIVPVERVSVKVVPIEPFNFAIDPTARTIDEALGCAHVMLVPRHTITRKQAAGTYRNVPIAAASDGVSKVRKTFEKGESSADPTGTDDIKITEYHGLVPKRLMPNFDVEEEFVSLFPDFGDMDELPFDIDGNDLVEAIVTVANDSVVLKAVENPHIMKDRSVVAYQHDTVPNRFWGRGVAEKGYNPQKALDAEMRARIDGLGFSNNPMMAIAAGSFPRGQASGVGIYPGKTIITNGPPGQELMPIQFPGPDPNTYRQTGELERMIQMGTGSMDSAAPVGISPRNNTASGMSMMMAGAIKRQKRTMMNIERFFLDPLVRKTLWRYMQFDPRRYPTADYKFKIHATMGIMAREFEQQQLSQLLNTVPPDSPAYWLLLDTIFENSSLSNKEKQRELIQQMLQSALQPKDPASDPAFQLEMAKVQMEGQRLQLEQQKQEDYLSVEAKKAMQKDEELRVKQAMVEAELAQKALSFRLEYQKVEAEVMGKQADAALSVAKAEAQEQSLQLEAYTKRVESLLDKYKIEMGAYTGLEDTLTKAYIKLNEFENKTKQLEGTVKRMEKHPVANNTFVTNENADLSDLQAKIDQLEAMVQTVAQAGKETEDAIEEVEDEPIRIIRDAQGRIASVNGREVRRNAQGLIEGLA